MNDFQSKTLPAERFFWAELDVSSLPGAKRRDRRTMGYLFESHLPISIDEVQVAFVAERAIDCVIACGMKKADLADIVTTANDTLTLSPQDIPAWLGRHDVSPMRFNLLHGEFEPSVLRRRKRRIVLLSVLCVLAIAVMIITGVWRRADAMTRKTNAVAAARNEVINEIVQHSVRGGSAQPPELRMLAELRSLRQTRGQTSANRRESEASGDAIEDFVALLEQWPRDLYFRTDSILITTSNMTLRGTAVSTDDAQTLANALNSLPSKSNGWQQLQPQVSANKSEEVSVTLQWRRQELPRTPTADRENQL